MAERCIGEGLVERDRIVAEREDLLADATDGLGADAAIANQGDVEPVALRHLLLEAGDAGQGGGVRAIGRGQLERAGDLRELVGAERLRSGLPGRGDQPAGSDVDADIAGFACDLADAQIARDLRDADIAQRADIDDAVDIAAVRQQRRDRAHLNRVGDRADAAGIAGQRDVAADDIGGGRDHRVEAARGMHPDIAIGAGRAIGAQRGNAGAAGDVEIDAAAAGGRAELRTRGQGRGDRLRSGAD